eukprot:TRINITY_DN14667_c0_g1_i4.p1 TRINITY_DN14667_c0_g1~~TRINITY_DN14667_c0_g1_i4.p1  ORF type:complete len:342 (-),score=39.90 TRINITY_DN14667_c0_g1_i4:144-1169(-)
MAQAPRQKQQQQQARLAHAGSTASLFRLGQAQRKPWFWHASSSTTSGLVASRWMDVSPTRWGVTKEDLRSFNAEVWAAWKAGEIPEDPDHPNADHDDPAVGPNIYAVCKHFIKPRTLEAGEVSWALMKHPEGLLCDTFASHSWFEGIFEFVNKALSLWPSDARHLYCCFLSNPQNSNIQAMLGDSAMTSPFAVAMANCKYLLIVPNRQQSIYERLWCVFETHLALQLGLQIYLPSRPPCMDMVAAILPRMAVAAATFLVQTRVVDGLSDSHFEELVARVLFLLGVFTAPYNVSSNRLLANVTQTHTLLLCNWRPMLALVCLLPPAQKGLHAEWPILSVYGR